MATARAYNKFALHLTKGEIAWQGASLRVALLKNTYSPDVNTHDIWGDISTHEASGTGYVAGGATVTPSTPTQETLSLGVITKLPCSNASWAGLTTTYRYVVIYLYNATAGLRYLVGYYDEGEDKTLAGQPLTVDFGDGVAILAGATTQHNSLLGIEGVGTSHVSSWGANLVERQVGLDIQPPVTLTNLVSNGDFSNGTTGWSGYDGTVSDGGGYLVSTGTGTSPTPVAQISSVAAGVSGRKYYVSMKARVTSSACTRISAKPPGVAGTQVFVLNPVINQWYSNGIVVTATSAAFGFWATHTYADAATANGKVMEVDNVVCIDLTACFGAGNEPTAAQMDALLTQAYPATKWFNGTVTVPYYSKYSDNRFLGTINNVLGYQPLSALSTGTVVADVTLDGAWKDGATVDAGANTITVASATGLANGTPIEFRANTGVLPAGITDYLNGAKGIGDGDYFNIINLSGTTFQITATVGGSTPVDITSAGTAGWQWRVAGAGSISATGLSLDTHLEYMVMILTPLARKSSSADSLFTRLNNSTYNQFLWFAYPGSTWGANTTPGPNSQTFTQKYNMNIYLTRIRKIESGKLVITSWVSGSESDNRTTATAKTFTGGQALGVYTPQNVTDIYVSMNTGAALIRNGSRIIVVRRGL